MADRPTTSSATDAQTATPAEIGEKVLLALREYSGFIRSIESDGLNWLASLVHQVEAIGCSIAPRIQDASTQEWFGDINPNDFEIHYFGSGAASGQMVVNKNVRITHKPTGIVVESTSENTQYSNNILAWNEILEQLTHLNKQFELPFSYVDIDIIDEIHTDSVAVFEEYATVHSIGSIITEYGADWYYLVISSEGDMSHEQAEKIVTSKISFDVSEHGGISCQKIRITSCNEKKMQVICIAEIKYD